MTGRQVLFIGIFISILLTYAIWLGGGIPASIIKLPDQGLSWYYWKLPHPTFWSRATAWGMYLGHQFGIWACIWWAQQTQLKYKTALHPINYAMLAINGAFIALHFLQTYIWYDALAQDTSIWASQGAVVLLLVFILILETPRRGLFFGNPVPFHQEFLRIIKVYHGYFFSFAAIYTFWYHPMEATAGHLIGFFYMFLLLLQSSLIFNRAHTNRWWTFSLEITVLLHSVVVSWMLGQTKWPTFLFGFLGILVLTQLHGLPVSSLTKRTIYGIFLVSVIAVYGLTERGLGRIYEVTYIPLIEFGLVGIIYLVFMLILWTFSRLTLKT
ncbi:hypothetical protein [Nostoc sp. UHCC 0870]|uniref:hypothetical protein n=1 Tax=Nostoc sp. UHCC 0870 TaxID=2914041 RepID=UPI001EDD00F9|nr:hypothetical protein [Nostoc sp. UHCC 0870]UKO99068.1 hypothetical protein L6494_04915 [Nostoc sp. UHCC 0870]